MSEIKVVPCPDCSLQSGRKRLVIDGKTQGYCRPCEDAVAERDILLGQAAQSAARPVETRPPAPTPCGKTGFAKTRQESIANACNLPVGHEGKCSHENPEPVEQAAPPRPPEYDRICAEHDCLLNDDGTCPYCRDAQGKPFVLDMQSYHLKKRAAIEQARPQPSECPQCKGKKILSCGEIGTVYCTLCAAAEPAPERTQTNVYDRAREAIKLLKPGMQMDTWLGDVIQNEIAQALSARAVAVPEPAAQQESESEAVERIINKFGSVQAFFKYLDEHPEARRQAEPAPGLMPSCTVCGKIMQGVCECGNKTGVSEPAPTPSLRKFVQHLPNCRVLHPIRDPEFGDSDCSCGLKKALAEASSLGTKEEHEI